LQDGQVARNWLEKLPLDVVERFGRGILGIVRQLVELHGGTVQAASPGLGQGATFTVCLPFAASASEDQATV
jgi:signal transduction histidine kinase